ncbi:MAG: hypothetical protein O2857_30925 [Planctomycetota bacterium]|nr:hypothetical protein [Planctomycetota bacterium]
MSGERLAGQPDGQNPPQGVHPERDRTGGKTNQATEPELTPNPNGHQNREISAKRDRKPRNIRETDPASPRGVSRPGDSTSEALQELINRWDSLPEDVRSAILTMVRTIR